MGFSCGTSDVLTLQLLDLEDITGEDCLYNLCRFSYIALWFGYGFFQFVQIEPNLDYE